LGLAEVSIPLRELVVEAAKRQQVEVESAGFLLSHLTKLKFQQTDFLCNLQAEGFKSWLVAIAGKAPVK
jgi:hypothetical protein